MLWSIRVRVQISPDGCLGYLKIPAISSVGSSPDSMMLFTCLMLTPSRSAAVFFVYVADSGGSVIIP